MPPLIKTEGAITLYSNPDLGIKEKMFASTCNFFENPEPANAGGQPIIILGQEPTGVVTQKRVEDVMGNIEYIDIPMETVLLVNIIGTTTIRGIPTSSLDQD